MKLKMDYASIVTLPTEVLEKIFKLFDSETVISCRYVCKRWMDIIVGCDSLWRELCQKELGVASRKAKDFANPDVTWYHIYRNFKMWPDVVSLYKRFIPLSSQPKFADSNVSADMNQGILMVNTKGSTMLLDVTNMRHRTILILGNQICDRICYNEYVTVIKVIEKTLYGVENNLYIQRTVESDDMVSEAIYNRINIFLLLEKELYYSTTENEIYRVNLLSKDIKAEFIHKSPQKVVELIYNDELKVFTTSGKVFIGENFKEIDLNHFFYWHCSCYDQHHFSILNADNYISYCSQSFRIKTTLGGCQYYMKYGFPTVTATYFYGDIFLIATDANDILLYQFCKQDQDLEVPVLDRIGKIPGSSEVTRICVCETKWGPIIMASTNKTVYLLRAAFFPEERKTSECVFSNDVLYKRLLTLRDRIEENSKKNLPMKSRKRPRHH